jgi:hypothetical protein
VPSVVSPFVEEEGASVSAVPLVPVNSALAVDAVVSAKTVVLATVASEDFDDESASTVEPVTDFELVSTDFAAVA